MTKIIASHYNDLEHYFEAFKEAWDTKDHLKAPQK